jgi:hypothetical protein
MPSHTQCLRLLVVTAIVLVSVLTAGAQSGRKVRKTAPVPVPTSAPESTPAKPAEQPKPMLTLVVGMERSNIFEGGGMVNSSNASRAFVDRINDHPGVKVHYVSRDMGRGEAVRRAKSEKEAYVVLLELSLDRMGASNSELRLSYSVFSPTTAKIKTSGQTYPHLYRNRGGILNPRTANIYGDYQVQEASREAAERILKAFHLHLPDGRRAL